MSNKHISFRSDFRDSIKFVHFLLISADADKEVKHFAL